MKIARTQELKNQDRHPTLPDGISRKIENRENKLKSLALIGDMNLEREPKSKVGMGWRIL
jgi:hypothetical protein